MLLPRNANSGPDAPALPDAQQREQFHRQILSSVSHDLKTPLASIIGSLEVYKRMGERLSEQQQNSLIGVALQEAYRLDNFITNILDMARLENGLVKMRTEQIAVGQMLEDCVSRFGHRLKNDDVVIEPSTGLGQMSTDPTLLARAVCLLIDNAVKYGGTPPAIHITAGRQEDGRGFIRVTDNGPGIPPDRLLAIFAKYTRFARGDQQNAGTGLGLPICREIMRLLEGDVTAANGAQGAVFTLRFPVG